MSESVPELLQVLEALCYPPVLTQAHVARLLGLPSERSALTWLTKESVPTITVAKRILVMRDDLLVHLEGLKQVAVPKALPGKRTGRRGRRIRNAAERLAGGR